RRNSTLERSTTLRNCIEDSCGADISNKGNRAKRCDDHQRAFHASRQRDYYGRVKDAVSTRRILRRQGMAEYEGPHDTEVIDYTVASPALTIPRSLPGPRKRATRERR